MFDEHFFLVICVFIFTKVFIVLLNLNFKIINIDFCGPLSHNVAERL